MQKRVFSDQLFHYQFDRKMKFFMKKIKGQLKVPFFCSHPALRNFVFYGKRKGTQ